MWSPKDLYLPKS
jgi:hypothetical protein